MNQTIARLRKQPPATKGFVIALVGTVLWSTTAILIRYLNDVFGLPPLVLAFWRDALVSSTLLIVFLVSNRALLKIHRKHLRFLLIYGFILAVYNAIWTLSVKYNGAAISTVLVYSSSATTALLERLFFKIRIGPIKAVAISLSILGVILVSGAYGAASWDLNFWGILVGLFSGFLFSVFSLMGRETARREINTWTALFYTFLLAALFLLGFHLISVGWPIKAGFSRLLWLGDSVQGWGVLILLAVGPTVGGYGLYTLSLRYLQATVSNLIATLEPPLTTLEAYVFLGERLTFPQLMGGLLTVAGVIVLRIRERRTKKLVAKS